MVAVIKKCKVAPSGFAYVPPDGGFGWWVLFGSCLAGALAVVPLTSFGLFLVDIINDLGATTSAISWIPSIGVSASMLFAPVANIIIRKYSCRVAAICGGVMMSLGMMLCYFATNVVFLFFTLGVIYGAGMGCAYSAIILVLSEYFREHFGLATGIATAFFSVGKLVFSPIVQLMLQTMDYHSVFLLIGALCLNVCVGGALFQPSVWHFKLKAIPEQLPVTGETVSVPKDAESGRDDTTNPSNVKKVGHSETENGNADVVEKNGSQKMRSTSCRDPENDPATEKLLLSETSKPEVKLASSGDVFGSVHSITMRDVAAEVAAEVAVVKEQKGCYSWWKNGPFKLDMRLLVEPIFHVIMWGGMLSSIVSVYQIVYLPSLIVENGLLPMQAAAIVSVKSGGEIMGRIITTYVQGYFKTPILPLFLGLYLIQVGLLVLFTFLTSFTVLMILTVLAGFVYGGYAGLVMLVYVDGVGHGRLPAIFALTKFLQGILVVGVGPLIGFVKDVVGAYSVCFYILAVVQLTCTLVWALHPLAKRKSFAANGSPKS